MKKMQREMGSKNPLVVMDDADLKTAITCAVWKEARPLMVNEDVPMSPTQPYHRLHAKQLKNGGIPEWKTPQL